MMGTFAMIAPGPRLCFLPIVVLLVLAGVRPLCAEDVPTEKVFAALPFDQWVKQGPQVKIPWKVQVRSYGLSLHQRLLAHIHVELKRRELAKLPPDDRILVLLELTDATGKPFRDYVLFQNADMGPQTGKGEIEAFWNMYVLPGEYKVIVALVDGTSGEHNLMQGRLRVTPLKNDPMPQVWTGLPAVEFLDPLSGPDAMFRSDVSSKLHLPLATKHTVRVEVLADVTASDLFHGSTVFYNRYLSVALPLLKALSQISLERGSVDVAMLDLRKRAVTFEQNEVRELDWQRAKAVLAPENGPSTIDIKALEQSRESPAFLQDELLRRLNGQSAGESTEAAPLHVFVIIGSPMDFYSFRGLPRLPAGSEERCVVYYLQFELLNPGYADGAIGNVRKMLKPLPVRVFKVRSPESIRHALAKIVEEVSSM
jgi:hypothetical protein